MKRINVVDETTGEIRRVIAGALTGPVVDGNELKRPTRLRESSGMTRKAARG